MVELLPAWYDEMARRYEALFPKVSFLDGFLKAYIALEYKIVDCGKLSDAETIEELELNYGGEHVRGRKKQKYALHKRVRAFPMRFPASVRCFYKKDSVFYRSKSVPAAKQIAQNG